MILNLSRFSSSNYRTHIEWNKGAGIPTCKKKPIDYNDVR